MKKSTCWTLQLLVSVTIWMQSVYELKDVLCKFLHLTVLYVVVLLNVSFFRSQIRQTLKKKAFEDAGIPIKQITIQSTQQSIQQQQAQAQPQQQQVPQQQQQQIQVIQQQQQQQTIVLPGGTTQLNTTSSVKQEVHQEPAGLMNKSAEVMMTLNRLNTQESEVDVEGLSSDVKMEFETVTEEVAGWNELNEYFFWKIFIAPQTESDTDSKQPTQKKRNTLTRWQHPSFTVLKDFNTYF